MKAKFCFKPSATFPASAVIVFLLGLADCTTGYELGFFVFYFLPIAFVAWNVGPVSSYVISGLSAMVWFTADWYSNHLYSHSLYAWWNAAIRLLAFLIIGYSVSKIRASLKEAAREVQTLSGLLPICANCKKVRDDRGYWQQIEEYIGQHSKAIFTHGLCQTCADKFLQEAGLAPSTTQNPAGGDPASPVDAIRKNPQQKL
jgi:hypothetical protein